MKIATCTLCHKEFEAVSSRQKICTETHYIDCPGCGERFEYKRRKTYCSPGCGGQKGRTLAERTCKLCSKNFVPSTGNGSYCSNPHPFSCEVCDQEFFKEPTTRVKTCSKACAQAKREATNMDKYGVTNVNDLEDTKRKIIESSKRNHGGIHHTQVAEVKEKVRKTNRERYGASHPQQSEQVRNKTKQTLKDRYGIDNPIELDSARRKMRETNLDRYGVEYSFQSEEVKAKIRATNLDRYGVEHSLQNEEVRQRGVLTNLERYGVENAGGAPEVLERIRATNMERLGVEHSFQSDEVKAKIRITNLERYGVENPALNEDVRRRTQKTNRERYGFDNPMSSPEVQAKVRSSMQELYGVDNPSLRNVIDLQSYAELRSFLAENPSTVAAMSERFGVTEAAIRRKVREESLDPYVIGRYAKSAKEEMFWHEISDMGVRVVRNDRKLLGGKEIDFYFPDHNLAVEISPTSTHNAVSSWPGVDGKDRGYHKNKFTKCADQGVELVTVFDWHPWNQIIEMVKHRLSGSQRVFARNCDYQQEAATPDIRSLVRDWHVLGMAVNMPGVFEAGLLTSEGEIVGIALWGSPRDGKVELKRMVFKPGVSVVGGASKLLKNYLKRASGVSSVVTFSDCDLGTGSVYSEIGFKLIQEAPGGMNFYSSKHRKHIKYLSLVKQGADRLLRDIPGYVPVGIGEDLPTNVEIVQGYGFLPVYDCGYRKWEYHVSD